MLIESVSLCSVVLCWVGCGRCGWSMRTASEPKTFFFLWLWQKVLSTSAGLTAGEVYVGLYLVATLLGRSAPPSSLRVPCRSSKNFPDAARGGPFTHIYTLTHPPQHPPYTPATRSFTGDGLAHWLTALGCSPPMPCHAANNSRAQHCNSSLNPHFH